MFAIRLRLHMWVRLLGPFKHEGSFASVSSCFAPSPLSGSNVVFEAVPSMAFTSYDVFGKDSHALKHFPLMAYNP